MKQVAILCAGLLLGGLVFAGGIENKTNLSPGYLRNPSRNVESKRPEASFYNIAGTAFMEDGLHVEVGNQFVAKEYSHTLKSNQMLSLSGINESSYNDETFVWLYPNFDVVYKRDSWAAFVNFGVFAGGGNLTYSEGTGATTLMFLDAARKNPAAAQIFLGAAMNHEFEVSAITYGGQIGGAYAFPVLEGLSVGAALRFTYGTQEMSIKSGSFVNLGNGGSEISYTADALAFSGVFGVHVKPVGNLDVSAQFQMASQLEYEIDDVKGNLASSFGISNGAKFRTDISPVLNLGVGYQVLEPLYVSAGFNYYFNTAAKINSVLGETDYDNSFEVALGADYDINKYVSAGLGFAYGKQGTKDDANSVFNPVLDSFQIGAGAEVRPIENLTLTGALSWVKYFNEDYSMSGYEMELEKTLFMFAIGGTYRFDL